MGFENGKLVRVVVSAKLGSDSQVNVLHYDLDDNDTFGGAENDPQSLADFFRDNVIAPFRALYSSAWTIQPVIVEQEKDPLNPNAPRSAWTSGSATLGTSVAAGDALPRSCCTVTTLKTAHIGRRFTGRMFVSGIVNEAKQNNGLWDPSWITLVDAYVAAIPKEPDVGGPVSPATARWCVFSRTQRAQSLDPYASAVKSHFTHQEVHWLRSRQQF
jgi:hypothetical protein